ncbi:MAG: hypothetical protein KDN04_13355 [Verrucomicrobiae bacterium]|nr:hypothetical protein [Verrucomicrobiae bacterium]
MKTTTAFLTALTSLAAGIMPAAGVEFEPWSYTEKDLFPSAIIATATVDWNGDEETAEDKKTADDAKVGKGDVPIYGDENGWMAVSLFDVPAKAKVTVEISIDGYLKPSVWTGSIKKASDEVRIFPKCLWDYDALHQVREQKPVNVVFKVTVNGTKLPDQTETCALRSINDCPFYVLWDENGEDFDDFSWMFAAYVNENHPWIDGILKEALQSGLISSFTGYQSGNPDEVQAQVFAIWNVLQRRGIKYSDISATTPSKFVISQSVRFLDDTIESTQANCVDGTVLMASILRKIGINAYLVMVPGHCFLAFDSGPGDDDDIVGLETTLLGENNLKPVKELATMPEKLKQKEFAASLKTFASAIAAGSATMDEHAEDLESGENPDTQLISVSDARELGIMPIASGVKRN